MKSIYKLRYKCKNIDIKSIIQESFFVAILSIIGFSIYFDLVTMNYSREFIISFLHNKNSHAFLIASIISLFILFSLVFETIVTGKKDECEISE